jgi:RNA polymerase sigma-70 factor (ECF subfamily)
MQVSLVTPAAEPPPLEHRFRATFDAEYAFVWRTVRRFGIDEAGVDDVAQEVFVVLARRLAEVEPGRERSFLYGAARRVASDARKARGRVREAPSERSLLAEADPRPSPEEELHGRESRALLDRALDALDDPCREVLVLSELEGLSKSEVAALVAIPEGTVASRLRRAREDFRAALVRLSRGGAAPPAREGGAL